MMLASIAVDQRIARGWGDVRTWPFRDVVDGLILQHTLNLIEPEPEQPRGR